MRTILMARVALGATAAHAILFLALHALEPEISPVSGIISDYSGSVHASWATAAFLAFGLVWGAMALALSEAGRDRTLTVGRLLLALATVAILWAAFSPASADPRTGSVAARIQNLVARPGLFLGILLVSIGLGRSPRWEATARALVILALSAAILLVITIALLLERGLGGLGQRALFLLLYAWVLLVARRILAAPVDSLPTHVETTL